MTAVEQDHISQALRFELGKVKTFHVRERVVDLLMNIDIDLAMTVARGIGVVLPAASRTQALRAANERLLEGWQTYGTTGLPGRRRRGSVEVSEALSQLRAGAPASITGRRVAILAADGVDAASIRRVMQALAAEQAMGEVVSLRQGVLTAADGSSVVAEHTVITMPSVLYDGVFVPGGMESMEALCASGDAVHYIAEAFKHYKPIAVDADAEAILDATGIDLEGATDDAGVLRLGTSRPGARAARLVGALKHHRFWSRPDAETMPA